MTPALYVAAGGGGDAIAATMLAARDVGSEKPCIATYAWDRLLIDPLPGPRSIDDFDGLTMHTATVAEITPDTAPRAPAGSTLPRLAGEIDARLFLLDPYTGAVGMARQLTDMAVHLGCSRLVLVDVGGDILGHGDEPELRSPLADSLALVACTLTDLPCRVLVAGAGLDGELTEAQVISRCQDHGAQQQAPITADEAAPFRPLFEWHPSEVTGLLVAAATGHRGTVEIRDQGLPIHLTDTSAFVYELPPKTLISTNAFAGGLNSSKTLEDIEQVIRSVRISTEIDYERNKNRSTPTACSHETVSRDQLETATKEARSRGSHYVTIRRFAELLDIQPRYFDSFRAELRLHDSGRYNPPLWAVCH
ncbi:MAG: DUF1152 domain-containing protein [Pseudonocardiaceae bacterium]|nr:DUF1152 domain-containing protein [Pseudonocardiaceae bacterium]